METKTDNELIAEFMGWPTPKIGSLWNYNQSLDNSQHTKELIVEDINQRGVKFRQKMAFERYGLEFFDGQVFYPAEWKQQYILNKHHCPIRPYDTSWDWLMPVIQKIAKLCLETDWGSAKKLDEMLEVWNSLSYEISGVPKIEKTYKAVVEFVKWYNQLKSNQQSPNS